MQLCRMIITVDPEMASRYIMSGCKVAAIMENATDKMPGAVAASMLLPPYEAIGALLDNDMNQFDIAYGSYLSRKEPMMYILALVLATISGKEIVIYVEPNEFCDSIVSGLIRFMQTNFGINPESVLGPYMYNSMYDANILNMLYLNDFIPANEFLALYPMNVQFDMTVLQKMVAELNPLVNARTPEEYIRYFSNFSKEMKESKMILIDPLVYCDKDPAYDNIYN